MLRPQALSVTFAILASGWVVGCRDWDRFDPTASGGGGAAPSTGSNATNGSNGSNGSNSGSGAGSTGGGGSGGSGTGGDACGTVDILTDEWDAAVLDWRWEGFGPPGAFGLEGGDLVVNLPTTEEYAQLQSTAAYDIRGRTMILEITEPRNPNAGIWFNIGHDPGNYIEIFADPDGQIYYNHEIDDDFETFAGEALSPDEYRFWRFREADNSVYFDLSTDGVSWMERTSYDITGLIDPAYAYVYVGASTYGTGNVEQARMARVYSGEPTTLGPCPVTVLSDDFEDGSQASVWDDGWSGSECWVEEVGGLLSFSCNPAADDDAGYASMAVFDLTSSAVSVEVAIPPELGTDAFLNMVLSRPEAETLFGFHVHSTSVEIYQAIDGNWVQVASEPWEPVGGRFLRIREAGGTVYFEYSPDNQQYQEVTTLPAPFDVTSLQVVLYGGAEGGNVLGTTAAFDNFNLGP